MVKRKWIFIFVLTLCDSLYCVVTTEHRELKTDTKEASSFYTMSLCVIYTTPKTKLFAQLQKQLVHFHVKAQNSLPPVR